MGRTRWRCRGAERLWTFAGAELARISINFRVQQFAIWTITSNPARSGYVHLGTFGVGSGSSAAELREIKAMFRDTGTGTGKYQALP